MVILPIKFQIEFPDWETRFSKRDQAIYWAQDIFWDVPCALNERPKELEQIKNDLKIWTQSLKGNRSFLMICNEKIKEFQDDGIESNIYLDGLYKIYFEESGEKKDWYEWAIGREKERLRKIQSNLKRWEFKKLIAQGKNLEEKELNIDGAKNAPIAEILGVEIVWHNGRAFLVCPLGTHNDSSPSFCWYKESRKGHCFGCNWNGDTIDVYMAINGTNFVETIKILNKI